MTFQWTAVSAFLYGEIGVLLLLCLPIISPQRIPWYHDHCYICNKQKSPNVVWSKINWVMMVEGIACIIVFKWHKIFMISIWNKITNYWNKAFLTIIVILIVLFLDAVREVRKYSGVRLIGETTHSTPSALDHIHMKLFRSQRNLYISGFSLFLWLVLRRTISLVTSLAKEMEAQSVLEAEIASTTEVARKYLKENEKLQHSLKKIQNVAGKEFSDVTNKKLLEEVEHLKAELRRSSEALNKTTNEITAAKKRSADLKKEYDLLIKEHEKLQSYTNEDPNKKVL